MRRILDIIALPFMLLGLLMIFVAMLIAREV